MINTLSLVPNNTYINLNLEQINHKLQEKYKIESIGYTTFIYLDKSFITLNNIGLVTASFDENIKTKIYDLINYIENMFQEQQKTFKFIY